MSNSSEIVGEFSEIIKNQWRTYALQNKRWFDSHNLKLIISKLFIQFLLESIEYNRMLLVDIVDIEKINRSVKKHNKMKQTSTLSHIAYIFDEIFKKTKYGKVLHNPLRNAIAHNDYFWEVDKLVYGDKEKHKMSIDGIMIDILKSMFIGLCITREIRGKPEL